MSRTTVTRTIRAPMERVFDILAHTENYSKAVPSILRVEHLAETTRGVGTRFRETRLMGKCEVACVLEVTEYEPHSKLRIVTDTSGTVWDTTFTLEPAGSGTVNMTMVMDAKPHKFMAKIFNPMIKGMVRKGIEKDMDAVKEYCEAHA